VPRFIITPPLRYSTTPSREEFRTLAQRANLIPVVLDLIADVETPVSAFARISGGGPSFLFESAEKNEESGRFSYIGFDPLLMFDSRGDKRDPLAALQETMASFQCACSTGSRHFLAGSVGYIGYDVVPSFEPTVPLHPGDDLKIPSMMFMIPRNLLVFDHRFRKLKIVRLAQIGSAGIDAAFDDAVSGIASVAQLLRRESSLAPLEAASRGMPHARGSISQERFETMVVRAKEHIAAGDIFQVVLSQRFETDFAGSTIDLYRALRFGNPSPYMFCLQFRPDFAVVGSSPEVHLRVRGDLAELRPIAGTYRRGKDAGEDEQLAQQLVRDPKERAEHVMLIDLARNDLGRVCDYGTVRVTEQMVIERYSHVMHIVSHVEGRLRPGKNAFDAIRATFPAGTVSGAPKIRAMQIIAELEQTRRGFYAGIVGLFGFDGAHDSCIGIRSVVLKNGKAFVQTGAGIVADSDPASEYNECMNKAQAMLEAIARATPS
jgi:anthranilate synthase component 1